MKKPSLKHHDLKNTNRSVVLNLILKNQPISRIHLSSLAGLTHGTVGKLVNELINCGLVAEIGSDTTTKRLGGPNPILLNITNGPLCVAAIHIGVTFLSVGLVSLNAKMLDYETCDLDRKWDVETLLAKTIDTLQRIVLRQNLNFSADILGIGVCVGGIVDSETGTVCWHDIPFMRNMPLRKLLEEKTNKPIFVDNVINAQALTESIFGCGQSSDSFVFILIAGIVGCATIINGQIIQGHRHSAGQIGHIVVDPNGLLCSCGQHGCLQTVTTHRSVLSRARELFETNTSPYLKKLVSSSAEITKQTIITAAKMGDAECTKILELRGQYIGQSIAQIVNLIDPAAIFLGIYVPNPKYFPSSPSNKNYIEEPSVNEADYILSDIEMNSLMINYTNSAYFKANLIQPEFIVLGHESTIIASATIAINKIFSDDFNSASLFSSDITNE